jgi:glutamate dehydrogenase/leucine dehydrogenase
MAWSEFPLARPPQLLKRHFWKEAEVNERLKELLISNFHVVRELAQTRHVTLRTTAYMIAIERVVKSLKIRGVYA